MVKKLSQTLAEGSKEAIAIALISYGVNLISQDNIIVGGAMVFIGWILLIIDRYLV